MTAFGQEDVVWSREQRRRREVAGAGWAPGCPGSDSPDGISCALVSVEAEPAIYLF